MVAQSRVVPLPRRAAQMSAPVLAPGRNVWELARADRASVLIDAAAYFQALREAMLAARHTIHIVGWDIDSRTRLVGPKPPTDGLPESLGDFLRALVEARPQLSVKLLLWDYSILYALEREMLPTVHLQWNTPRQIELCLDDMLPFGASHHQKIVVIDDAVAFSGGLDLTIRRWDTNGHHPDNPHRVDPAGAPYAPFHDVQMAVDGGAARALGRLVRGRWRRATGERLGPAHALTDPWPRSLVPDFTDVCVGVSRTRAAYGGEGEVREIEALLKDLIASAERTLYIESQFLTCSTLCKSLIDNLKRNPALEVLIIAPQTHHTWLEHQTMQSGRARVMRSITRAGFGHRVRLVHPQVGPSAVMVHSKVMIVDDRLLRVGSSNLCNRSMGTDTECDLTIEARGPQERRAIRAVRARFLSEHLGATEQEIEAVIDRTGSIFQAMDSLGRPDRNLLPIEDAVDTTDSANPIEAVADPPEPLLMADGAEHTPERRRRWGALAAMAGAVLLAVLAWRFTDLATWTEPDKLQGMFTGFAASPWAPVLVVLAFVLGGLVAFPVTVMIAATAITFGTWSGLAYGAAGALASAIVTYSIGRFLGPKLLRNFMGPRLSRIQRRIGRQGILTIATIRLVPIAPFTLVNLVAGAMRLPLLDYTIGTLMGLAPGLVVLSALGGRFFAIIDNPTWQNIALLAGGLIAWIALSLALQRVVSRRRHDERDT